VILDLFQARYEFERACDVVIFTGKDAADLIARHFSPVPADLRPIAWVAP
jgi:hypothetical protein